MTEFFDGGTNNQRKRAIEELLTNFSQQKDAWKHCLFFTTTTHNEYVIMFCCTVLENLINRQWVGFLGSDKMEVRSVLSQLLLSSHQQMPAFIRNKLVKLIVDIGRHDWPHFYPDFFVNILQLVQQPQTVSLGLVLLQTASEELACPREDLSVARKQELHRLLLAQVPTILHMLNGILESILEKHRSMVTATPPPSPTHGQTASDGHVTASVSVISSSPIPPGSILSNMFKSPQRHVETEQLPPLDTSSRQVAQLALGCLSHLFSWIPLSRTITTPLLSTIFHFAAFGCEVSPGSTGSEGSSSAATTASVAGNHALGVCAMCCINELLAKNCVPEEFEDYLLQMFQQCFYLLQRITRDTTTNVSGNRLADMNDSYVDKFTEFLQLFVSIHLRRFEAHTEFPVLDLLALLFKYTFKQPTNDGFFSCLEIWGTFIDYLNTKLTTRSSDRQAVLARYQEVLLSLARQILQNLQFRYNQSRLDEMDDEVLDDDSETEWQHFLRQYLETVAKVADLFPDETFRLVGEPFQENVDIYLGLERHIVTGGKDTACGGRCLAVTAENECRRLHCSLRDLSSLLQMLGRLAHHFIGEHFMRQFTEARALIHRLIETVSYGSRVKLYEVKTSVDGVLQSDFIEVHAQAFAAVKAYSSWLAQFYVESKVDEMQRLKCTEMINTVVDTVLPMFTKEPVAERVAQSAAHLLLSVFTTVKPPFLLHLPQVQTFYNAVSHSLLAQHSKEVQLLVYRSLSNYLLLGWLCCGEAQQEWSVRTASHQAFVKQWTLELCQLRHVTHLANSKTMQEEAKPCIKRVLHIVADLIESMAVDGVSRSKQICYQSVEEVIQTTSFLFPIYIRQPDVTDEILGFFMATFQCLRVQMGVSFTEQIIRTFMTLFTKEQLTEIIQNESEAGIKVVDRFLKILQLIVQEPGSAFKAFLPNIISICMDHIYPIIAQKPTVDIKHALYELLHELLQNNWRYFFKDSVLTVLKGSQNDENVENQQQFIDIMQAFGQSFLQPDIAIFKQTLQTLQDLNSKWKLYHKGIFRETMLYQFLTVLLQVLVCRSHDLLQEEIAITVYNMASVDFDTFYACFLPTFLAGCDGIDASQKAVLAQNFKMDCDLPSFSQSLQRFVSDLRYYRLCNSSLPAGSVHF